MAEGVAPIPEPRPNQDAAIAGLEARYGTSQRALAVLWQENFDLREERRIAQAKLDAAEGKLPGEGTTVLDAEASKAWAAYKALGEPSDIKAQLDKVGGLEKDIQAGKRLEGLNAAAEAAGYNPDVLKDLKGADQLTFEVRNAKDDQGKDVKVAYVTGPKEGAKAVKLEDHAQEHWGPFMASLGAEPDETGGKRTTGTQPWPKQQKGPAPKTGPATHDEIVERKRTEDPEYAGVF